MSEAVLIGSVVLPAGLHPDTVELVLRFAEAMAEKLRKAEVDHDYSIEWKHTDWQFACRQALLDHLEKGDPLDVANYCAFMWHHHWRTTVRAVVVP